MRRRYFALALLMALAFLNYFDRSLLFPLLPLLEHDLQLSSTEVGLLTSGFHLVYAASAPLVGVLADRAPRKLVLLVALVAWSGITALSGTASGFTALLVWRSLTGLGEGGYFPTALSLIGDLFGPKERGLAIALHGVTTTLGGSAGLAAGGYLGARWGWRLPFAFVMVPGLLLAVIFALTFREPPRQAPAPPPPKRPEEHDLYRDPPRFEPPERRRSYLGIVTSPPVLLIALSAFAASFAMNGLNPFIPAYLASSRHMGLAAAGAVSGGLFAATLVGQLIGGPVSDRARERFRFARPLLVGVAYFCVAPCLLFLDMAPLAVALGLYGLTQAARGFAEPGIYATVLDAARPDERGAAQGFLLLMTFAGASFAPLVAGACIDHGGYRVAFAVLSLGALISSGLGFALSGWLRVAS